MRSQKDQTPRPAIVEVDPDGDYWLKLGKRKRRLLSRAEFSSWLVASWL